MRRKALKLHTLFGIDEVVVVSFLFKRLAETVLAYAKCECVRVLMVVTDCFDCRSSFLALIIMEIFGALKTERNFLGFENWS